MNRLERFQLSGALQAEEVGFDPDLAREYLPRVVTRYARDMAAGRWVMNGEPLILDPEGNLLDGRHRLAAVIEARVAVRFPISPSSCRSGVASTSHPSRPSTPGS